MSEQISTTKHREIPFWKRALVATTIATAGLTLAACSSSPNKEPTKSSTSTASPTLAPNKGSVPPQLPLNQVNQTEVSTYNTLVNTVLRLDAKKWLPVPKSSTAEYAVDNQPDGDVLVVSVAADKSIEAGHVPASEVISVVAALYPKGSDIFQSAVPRTKIVTSDMSQGIPFPGTVAATVDFNSLTTPYYAGNYNSYQELVKGTETVYGYVNSTPQSLNNGTVALRGIAMMDAKIVTMATDDANNINVPNFFPTMPSEGQSTKVA